MQPKPKYQGRKQSYLGQGINKEFIDKIKNIKFKQSYAGKELNIFVGKHNYPNLNIGFLGNENAEDVFDSPKKWAKNDFQISIITGMRSGLINSRFKAQVKTHNTKLLDKAQEVALSSSPVDVDIELNKEPKRILHLHKFSYPTGPSIDLKKISITSNPKIPKQVDYVVNDTDLKAVDALTSLYKKGIDEHYLTKILSTANLGLKSNRKIVPTRWSITAVDDSLGKELIKNVSNYPSCDYFCSFGGYLGNYYITMFLPGNFSYELFEIELDSGYYETDFETSFGRTSYAQNCVGGYYANRLAVLEKLKSMKRTGTILVIRFITDKYYQPLGVWVVREASRKSLNEKELKFSDKELMLKYVLALAKKYFNFNLTEILSKSKLLKDLTNQRKLGEFF
jgi:DNA repair protein NreA